MPAGRPPVLDEYKRREICALVSTGCPIEAAARYVGCSPTTVRREILRNEAFRHAIRHATTTARLEPLRAMQRAAFTHWRAAAWLLERTAPDQFGRQPDAAQLRGVRRVVDAIVHDAGQEIDDAEVRKRVRRGIRRAARRALRRLALGQHPSPKRASNLGDRPTSPGHAATAEERALERITAELDARRRAAERNMHRPQHNQENCA